MKDFIDEVLDKYGVDEIPGCARIFEPIVINEYSKKHLVMTISNWNGLLNPMGYVQGGILITAFDTAFGTLNMIATNRIGVSINIQTYFHKSLAEESTLRIVAEVKNRGNSIVYLTAEGFDESGELIASCHSNLKLK